MAVSMQQVKELRDITNAGMMDCKKALETANGNIEEALKILKEKGLADAKKRSDRETKEGGVYIAGTNKKVAIALIGCETDFVANNDKFQEACNNLVNDVLEKGTENPEDYKEEVQTVGQITKENVEVKKIRCIALQEDQCASSYIHGNHKIGVVVIYKTADRNVIENEMFKEMANNVALHVAASAPAYLTGSDVPQADIEEQKVVFAKQMEGEKKPANILENILNGKIAKYKSEVCLLEQKYIKDDKITVKQYVENSAKALNTQIDVIEFVRLQIGE